MVEVYGNGGHPNCRTCRQRIKQGDLCIRVDCGGFFKNPQLKSNNYTLKETTLRYCANEVCHMDISRNDRTRTNVVPLIQESLLKGNVTSEYLEDLKTMMPNTNFKRIWK